MGWRTFVLWGAFKTWLHFLAVIHEYAISEYSTQASDACSTRVRYDVILDNGLTSIVLQWCAAILLPTNHSPVLQLIWWCCRPLPTPVIGKHVTPWWDCNSRNYDTSLKRWRHLNRQDDAIPTVSNSECCHTNWIHKKRRQNTTLPV